jgi:hypothetical protein
VTAPPRGSGRTIGKIVGGRKKMTASDDYEAATAAAAVGNSTLANILVGRGTRKRVEAKNAWTKAKEEEELSIKKRAADLKDKEFAKEQEEASKSMTSRAKFADTVQGRLLDAGIDDPALAGTLMTQILDPESGLDASNFSMEVARIQKNRGIKPDGDEAGVERGKEMEKIASFLNGAGVSDKQTRKDMFQIGDIDLVKAALIERRQQNPKKRTGKVKDEAADRTKKTNEFIAKWEDDEKGYKLADGESVVGVKTFDNFGLEQLWDGLGLDLPVQMRARVNEKFVEELDAELISRGLILENSTPKRKQEMRAKLMEEKGWM